MSRKVLSGLAVVATLLAVAACTSTKPTGAAGPGTSGSAASDSSQTKFFNQADFDRQLKQRTQTPQGDPATPWLQTIDASYMDTTKYKKAPKWHLCFSN